MFRKEEIGSQHIGLVSSHLNNFHVFGILGMNIVNVMLVLQHCLSVYLLFYSTAEIYVPYCSVKPEILKTVGKAITTLPENFTPHRAVKKIYENRAQMIETGEGIDWGCAEALAFATLLVEGNHVRLSGQDVERGTFSHRHSVVHDQETGQIYCPLDHVIMNQNEEMFTVSNR